MNKMIGHYNGFLTFWAMAMVEDCLIFSDWLENGLYQYNLSTKRTKTSPFPPIKTAHGQRARPR